MVSCLQCSLPAWDKLGKNHTRIFSVKHVYSRISLSYKRGRVRSLLLARLLILYTSIR